VALWDDCFVRHYEPEIGHAAVDVLEAAGYEVVLPRGRACCGRPAFSLGRLDLAREWAAHNARVLAETGDLPIVFLEPSCFSMVYDDYRELSIEGASDLRARSRLFETFVAETLDDEPSSLRFRPSPGPVAVHAHCHAKALVDSAINREVLSHVPGCESRVLDTACCGMAGAFGAIATKYDLSMKLGRLLADKLDPLPENARVVASGTSCRHQIEHVTDREPLHMAELLAGALEPAG
jgi:Fe-S oxidoreductase